MSRNYMINGQSEVSTGRAAEILGCHTATVGRWADAGFLRASRTMGEHRRFSLTDIYRAKRMGTLTLTHSASQLQGPRDYQQDHALLMPEYGTFAVCDGMGGMDRGELCSEVAVRFVRERVPLVCWPAVQDVTRQMYFMLEDANDAVLDAMPKGYRGGTTATCAVFFRQHTVCIGHIGDSRLYRIRQGRCELLTQDHSVNGALMSGLGTDQEVNIIQANVRSWQRGDVFVFCSDGFSNAIIKCVSQNDALKYPPAMVERETCRMIARMVNEGMTADEMNEHVSRSCELNDNSTVVRVDIR